MLSLKPLIAQPGHDYPRFLNDLVMIEASQVETPPDWAIMQRHLMRAMEEAAPYYVQRFTRQDGTTYGGGPYDDVYEMFYNWPELYAMGGSDYFLETALKEYNAINRSNTAYDEDSIDYYHRLYKEFPRHDDSFHISEGMTLFYNLGLGNPTIPGNIQRARRFAGFYLNEDPEALNFDAEHTTIKSIFTGSEGPLTTSDAEYNLRYGHASLYPVVENLEPDWHEQPKRKREIQKLYDKIITRTDVPVNLGATSLVTNAYLYTGDEKYKTWVLDYVDAWMQRVEENDGLLPDNVGQSGKIGEYRQGQWWGGLYGWYGRYGLMMMFASMSVASECAYMLSGDPAYLELPRSQITGLLKRAKTTEEGQLLVPFRYKKEGWYSYRPMMVRDLAHLWHASMASEDWETIETLMQGNKFRPLSDEGMWGQNTLVELDTLDWKAAEPFDWAEEMSMGDRSMGKSEHARLMYYAGKNADWPLEALKADYREVMNRMHFMQHDPRDIYEIQKDDLYPNNPVITKALVQTTMGTPQSIYFGGLLRARLRYFDADRQRPGLPEDVAALVEGLEAERTEVHLVNLSLTETRRLIVQAGAFGEHAFTTLSYEAQNQDAEGKQETSKSQTQINQKYFMVVLPPATSIRLDIGTQRFVNQPTYAFPWQGGKVPVK
ncbi:MAG: hypothetical protein RIG62_01430 [Cyclobacteriaceae bacterium]